MTLTATEVEAVIRAGVPMAEDIGFTVDEAREDGFRPHPPGVFPNA